MTEKLCNNSQGSEWSSLSSGDSSGERAVRASVYAFFTRSDRLRKMTGWRRDWKPIKKNNPQYADRKRTITTVFAQSQFVIRSHPDCLFAVLAGGHHPLHRPPDSIKPKAGSFSDGIVPHDDALAATSTRLKTG